MASRKKVRTSLSTSRRAHPTEPRSFRSALRLLSTRFQASALSSSSFPPLLKFPLPLDGAGSVSLALTLPSDGSMIGLDLYIQAWCLAPDGSFSVSNAVELNVCQ